MKVISLVNGSLIARVSTVYSFYYAKNLDYKVEMVFIKRKKDNIDEVNENIKYLTSLAISMEVEVEFLIFEDLSEFNKYIENREIDIVFCSTRHKHSILNTSFVKKLIKQNIKVDLAVVKVVKMGIENNIGKIILPIRDSKLSVRKFSVFTTFLKSYEAKGEIYSVEKVSPLAFDKRYIKEKLQHLIFNLRHYLRLLKMMDIKISIRYNNAISETTKIKTHIAKNGYDLAIIGAMYNKKIFTSYHPLYKLFENPILNTIYFIPYEEEK